MNNMSRKSERENLERYSFTLPSTLINKIDEAKEHLEINRSMVVREALTHWLEHRTKVLDIKGMGLGLISFSYSHHDKRVVEDLLETQHNFHDVIMHNTHLHQSHESCFEIVVCKGDLSQIKDLGEGISTIKGVHNLSSSYFKDD